MNADNWHVGLSDFHIDTLQKATQCGGCLDDFYCETDMVCPQPSSLGGPSWPLAVYLVGMLAAFIYRFVTGCYFKPHRQLKKLAKKMEKDQMEMEMELQMIA